MKVTTHSGSFHADEVMACAILKMLAEHRGEEFTVIRTRDRETLKEAVANEQTIVIDVGGEHSVRFQNFDHHQRSFTLTRELSNGVKYSSAGLVWGAYGKALPGVTQKVWEIMDNGFISAIDAIDNGIEGWDSPISWIISGLNPTWQDQSTDTENENFSIAVSIAMEVLKGRIASVAGDIAAEQYVNGGLFLHEGETLLLEQFVPWQKFVCTKEEFSNVKFILFPDKCGEWRIQTVPTSEDSFESRKQLPERWAGLRDEEFSEVVLIDDGVFCHVGRFIAGTKTKESIIELARLANK